MKLITRHAGQDLVDQVQKQLKAAAEMNQSPVELQVSLEEHKVLLDYLKPSSAVGTLMLLGIPVKVMAR